MTYLDCMNHLTEKKLGLVTTTRHQSPFICDLCSFMSSEVLNEAFDSDVIVNSSTLYDIISRHQSPLIHMWFMFFHELWSLVLIWLLKNKQRKLIWKLYSAYSGMRYQSRIQFYKVSKKSISFSFCDQWKMRFSILLFKGKIVQNTVYGTNIQRWSNILSNRTTLRDLFFTQTTSIISDFSFLAFIIEGHKVQRHPRKNA